MTAATASMIETVESSPGYHKRRHKKLPGVFVTVMDMNPEPMIDVWSGRGAMMTTEDLDNYLELLNEAWRVVHELNEKNGR